MAHRSKTVVLDSWSVMAYLEDETAGTAVADIIADAVERDVSLMMTVVNLAEVWYLIARQTSIQTAEQTIEELLQLGIEPVDADWKLSREAATFKARNKMSLADCFAAALAKMIKAELLTGDPEFKQIDGEVKVRWL